MPKVTTTTTLKGGKKWTATLHPRGKGGKFTKKVGTPTESDKLRTKVSRKVLAKALSTKGLSLKKLATPKHDYSKMSLVELKGLAAKLGAKHPDKYKNRKQAWAEAISAHIKGGNAVPQVTKVTTTKKTEPKPKAVTKVTKTTASKPKATIPVGSAKAKALVKHVEDNLGKYKVADLKKIAEDLGAKAPTKYATRKAAWLDSMKSHVGSDVVPQVTKGKKIEVSKPPNVSVTTIPLNTSALSARREVIVSKVGKDMVEAFEKEMNTLLSSTRTFISLKSTDLEAILVKDGAFKTCIERNNKISAYNQLRVDVEARMFNIPTSQIKDRPIYGYSAHPKSYNDDTHSRMKGYGDVRVMLKKDVEERTTVLTQDSFQGGVPSSKKAFSAASFFNEGVKDMTDSDAAWVLDNYRSKKSLGAKVKENNYIETQIHGGVKATDVESIIIPRGGGRPNAAVIEWAKTNGVTIEYHDN